MRPPAIAIRGIRLTATAHTNWLHHTPLRCAGSHCPEPGVAAWSRRIAGRTQLQRFGPFHRPDSTASARQMATDTMLPLPLTRVPHRHRGPAFFFCCFGARRCRSMWRCWRADARAPIRFERVRQKKAGRAYQRDANGPGLGGERGKIPRTLTRRQREAATHLRGYIL